MRPKITVVGLGPAGEDLVSPPARRALETATTAFLRTARHPAAAAFSDIPTFDHHYEEAATFDEVYERIVADLVTTAQVVSTGGGTVVYAVPGSPLVAERTVDMLLSDPRVDVAIVPAMSFLDLAWARLGVDPVSAGVRLVDGTRFAVEGAGERGPLLVAQCWSVPVLSELKLAVDDPGPADHATATILYHLGMADEVVATVPWHDVDRAVVPDHLTSVWVPRYAAPVARELAALDELVRTLRRECPWDRQQTHVSLRRHLLEEAYEVMDAIDGLAAEEAGTTHTPGHDAAAHLEEELGDLLFQVFFHARLAAEEGRFTIADVARGLHDKLVSRHPHVFGELDAPDAETVVANWEELKKAEKGRASVTEGIPPTLPALALSAKLQRKAEGVPGAPRASDDALYARATELLHSVGAGGGGPGEEAERATAGAAGDLLWAVTDLVRRRGVEPEDALRVAALAFAAAVRDAEAHGG